MLGKKEYANGQITYKTENDRLTYFFKNGNVKAEGFFLNDLMEGEWKFYRENGQLWQVGTFTNGKKNGLWVRYNRNGEPEYRERFLDNKKVKKPE